MSDSKINNERLIEMKKMFGSLSLPNENIFKYKNNDVVIEKIQDDIRAIHPQLGEIIWTGCDFGVTINGDHISRITYSTEEKLREKGYVCYCSYSNDNNYGSYWHLDLAGKLKTKIDTFRTNNNIRGRVKSIDTVKVEYWDMPKSLYYSDHNKQGDISLPDFIEVNYTDTDDDVYTEKFTYFSVV